MRIIANGLQAYNGQSAGSSDVGLTVSFKKINGFHVEVLRHPVYVPWVQQNVVPINAALPARFQTVDGARAEMQLVDAYIE